MQGRDALATVAGMGGLASLPAGAVTDAGGGTLDLAILRATSPVIGGSRLEVVARVTNPTSHTVTNSMQLFDSSGTLLDSQELTLGGQSTDVVWLDDLSGQKHGPVPGDRPERVRLREPAGNRLRNEVTRVPSSNSKRRDTGRVHAGVIDGRTGGAIEQP